MLRSRRVLAPNNLHLGIWLVAQLMLSSLGSLSRCQVDGLVYNGRVKTQRLASWDSGAKWSQQGLWHEAGCTTCKPCATTMKAKGMHVWGC